ncbi:hypothetical protein ACFLVN_02610 [Chloroflexota bacterium]
MADSNFASNRIIYAASDTAGKNVMKWTIGTSTRWTDILMYTIPGGVYGLTTYNGVLYALEFNSDTDQSALWQCLSPAKANDTVMSGNSNYTTTATDADDAEVELSAGPRALKASLGKLWAVKTNGTNKLYRFIYFLEKISVRTPAEFTIPPNAVTGKAHDVVLSWERTSEATEYELEIALDENFNILVTTITIPSSEETVVKQVGPNQTGSAKVDFMAGVVYYWRMRITQPLYSYYSDARRFSIAPVQALVPTILTPKNGGSGVSRTPSFSWSPTGGATEYRFMLTDSANLTSSIADVRVKYAGFAVDSELDYGKTYYWRVKATAPIEGEWSALAYFIVEEETVEAAPPVVIQQLPPPVINMPEPPAPLPKITYSPPLAPPAPVIPGYVRTVIVVSAILLLVVIAMIVWTFGMGRAYRVRKQEFNEGLAYYLQIIRDFRGRVFGYLLRKLNEVLVNYLEIARNLGGRVFGDRAKKFPEKPANYSEARRSSRVADADSQKARNVMEGQSISFAAKSFLWMITSEKEKKEGDRMLSVEEQSLGRVIVSRIRDIAEEKWLYQEFPEDAALLLDIWSNYGSRDETNRHLTRSFQYSEHNVAEFLKCYLPASEGLESSLSHKVALGRHQYDSIARVVDPESVFEAIKKLYGPDLEMLEGEEVAGSPDKALAYQFVRIHHLVTGEPKKAAEEDALRSQI